MGTVAVHLDSRLGFVLAVGVAANVVTAVQYCDLQAQFLGGAFGNCKAEEA